MPNKELVLVGKEVELARKSAQYMVNALMENIRYQLDNGATSIYNECLQYIQACDYTARLGSTPEKNYEVYSDNTPPDKHG